MSPSPDRSTAVLVLGMHRSGTSALTRVLNLLGVDLGERLLGAARDNAAGFWENAELVLLHDRLLEAVGSAWHDPRPLPAEVLLAPETRSLRDELRERVRRDLAHRPLWGIKDPRLCRLVPVWKELLQELDCDARFVLTARSPREVAASLARRDGLTEAHARLLWLQHMLAAERDTRGVRRAFTTYDRLLEDWRGEARRLGEHLGFAWDEAIDRAGPAVDGFLDPGLRHHREGAGGAVGHAWTRTVWRAWEEASCGADPGMALAAVRDSLDRAGDLFFPWGTGILHEPAEVRPRTEAPAPIARGTAGEGALPEDLLTRPGTRVARTYERPEGRPRVSIVIPLFNQVELTATCLETLAEHTPDGAYEVILVDNGSTDSTPELLACLQGNVKIVVNDENLGFATACNQGAALAATDRVLFLNNDIEARPGWLEPLMRVMDGDPSVAVAGSRLLFPDGTVQHAGVALLHVEGSRVPLRAFHAHYGLPGDAPEAAARSEYQVVTGACLLTRKNLFESVGGFDRCYWNGCEDVDFCLRIGELGWTIVYEPESCLVHHESRSGSERYARVAANESLLCSRWLGKAQPDVEEDASGLRRRTNANRIRPYRLDPAPASPALVPAPAPGSADGSAAPEPPLTSILIVTRNQIEHTRQCVASLRRHTPEPHEIVFVDNGSTDGTREWLRAELATLPQARVIALRENRGFAGGNNVGLAAARGSRVVLLNNDTVVTEGWLSGLLAALDSGERVGLAGPVTNYASGPQVLEPVPYRSREEMEAFAARHARDHAGRVEEAQRLVGFCLAARREVVDDIGGLDEAFGAGNCEDDDWCLRAAQAGWSGRIARGVFIHHTGGRTFHGERVDYGASLEANFDVFKRKWGMDERARAASGYPFRELVAGPRQPRIPVAMPDGAPDAELGERWIEEAGARAADTPPADTPAPDTVPAGKARLQVGMLPGEPPAPAVQELFRRYGHAEAIPVVAETAILDAWLKESGLVLLLGPDVTVTDEALQELVSLVHGEPRIAAAGPVSPQAPRPQRISSAPARAADAAKFATKQRRRHRGKWKDADYLGGFCVLLRADAVQAAGGVDTAATVEDALWDLFGRLREAGHRIAVARGAWVAHERLTAVEGAGYDALATPEAGLPA